MIEATKTLRKELVDRSHRASGEGVRLSLEVSAHWKPMERAQAMFFKAFGSLVPSWSTIQITMHAKTGPTAGDIIASEMIREFPTKFLYVITDCFRTEHWE